MPGIKKNSTRITLAAFTCVAVAVLSVSADEKKSLEEFAERLKALEQHLGLPPSEVAPQDLDALFERLEALERAVYAPQPDEAPLEEADEPREVVAPPPPGMEGMDWRQWEGEGLDDEMAAAYSPWGSWGYESSEAIRNFEIPDGFSIGGYGSVSYLFDNRRRISTFQANAIEINLSKAFSDFAVFGVDLDFLNEGMDAVFPPFRHPSYGRDVSTGIYDTGGGGAVSDDIIIEQLFVEFRLHDALFLKGGKFNNPTGIEPRDPNTRFAVQPSLLYFIWPRDLTGVQFTYHVNDQLRFSPIIFNGWDNDENINDSFLYSFYAEYDLTGDLTLSGNFTYGPPFPNNNDDDAYMFDLAARYTGIDNLWLGMELMYVHAEADHRVVYDYGGGIDYYGALGLAHYRFHPFFGLTLQSSVVRDQDGFLWGEQQTRWEASVIPTFFFGESLELRLQWQHIESDTNMWRFFQPVREREIYARSNDSFMATVLWTY